MAGNALSGWFEFRTKVDLLVEESLQFRIRHSHEGTIRVSLLKNVGKHFLALSHRGCERNYIVRIVGSHGP
ncbi:hypothetical protein B1964_11300 [Gordonia sp. i37]|nr:hypothetical protein B1964_11300 [Gordonia sp. i37]